MDSFIAPEVAGHHGYGAAADWWSLGVLMYQCLTLATPFEGHTPKATIDNIKDNRRVHAAAVKPEGQPVGEGELSERAAGSGRGEGHDRLCDAPRAAGPLCCGSPEQPVPSAASSCGLSRAQTKELKFAMR